MRSSLLLTAVCTLGLAFALPAHADPVAKTETVTFEVNLDQSRQDILKDVSQQAWSHCARSDVNHTIAGRVHVRRQCQQRLVRDVMAQIEAPEMLAYETALLATNS